MKPRFPLSPLFLAALTATSGCATGSAADRPASAPDSSPASVRLSTGVRLEYVERGDPNGVPVILLHGYSDSHHSWDLTTPHLPASLRVFAISQRGHGGSDRPGSGYRPADFAADVAAFLDAKKIESAVIVGHSMGGIIAQRFAMDYPSRTRGLVLVATFAPVRNHPLFRAFYEETISRLTDPVDSAFVREFQISTMTRPVPAEFVELVIRESRRMPARVWHEVILGLAEEDQAAGRAAIRAPTLILAGELDAYSNRAEQEVLATIPGSRLEMYAGTGHALQWEEPVRFAADLARFVRGLSPSGG